LKNNLPELFAAAEKRFSPQHPHQVFWQGKERVEIWDANDFDPWERLRWQTVRVIRYRHHQPEGTVGEAYGLTDFPPSRVSRRTLFDLAKSRWEIENQGFNEAKNRYGFEPTCHPECHSLLAVWLLICLALTIERLPSALPPSGPAPRAHRHRSPPPLATQSGNAGASELQLRTLSLPSAGFPLCSSALPVTRPRGRVSKPPKNLGKKRAG
jgi:hypothetical protein